MTTREWLKKMGKRGHNCAKTTIVEALLNYEHQWIRTGDLNRLFCDYSSGFFVGVSWTRRIRELAEQGIVQRRIIKDGPHKGQAEWRVG